MKTRVLIADDEPLARERLKTFLATEPDIEVVGEATTGAEAIDLIQELKPALVFLDVQMPEGNGFEVLAQLPEADRPAIVFVTAYDQFAVKAFEVHAVDYLLKPFDRQRFQAALRRALAHVAPQQPAQIHEQLSALLADLRPKPPAAERLAVKSEGRVVFVNIVEIDWIEAADNYVALHVGKDSHLLRETMNALEARLAKPFMRISRSTIVNTERIKELQPLFHGDYAVILKDGTKLTLTRGYRDKLQELGV